MFCVFNTLQNDCHKANGGYYKEETVSDARDRLLTKLYYARHKETMGGYAAWHKLLGMYYIGNYQGMIDFIRSCRGKGGKTRNECIYLIKEEIANEKDILGNSLFRSCVDGTQLHRNTM